jgi:TPR repeat protein
VGEIAAACEGWNSHSRALTLRHYAQVLRTTLTAFLMLGAGPAVAGPWEDGYAAYDRGDYATALHLSGPLAEKGDTSAQKSLGVMYAKGHGVPQNYAEASKWYRLAAAQGNEFAQHNLGGLYITGVGVPQAYMWYSLSAALGPQDARDSRDKVALLMTPAQIAEAQKLTREWKPRTANCSC